MKKRVKGIAVMTVVLIAAATFAVGVGVGMWIGGQDGGFGGEDDAVPVDAAVTEEVTETTTEAVTTLTTEIKNAEYIEVTIDGDKYLYNGVPFDLDGFIAEITRDGKKFDVKIYFSDTATQFAYEELLKKLDENEIYHSDE